MTGTSQTGVSWSRVARRIRVPLGFAFAALYLWLARPTLVSLVLGAAVAALGVWVRAVASGHVKKNEELTTTGPYAYCRNPLYLGSIIIAAGFAIASLSIWVAVAIVVLFVAIYLPVIRSEEGFLRSRFGNYDSYAARVPRLLPTFCGAKNPGAGFSRELYMQHREYNATLGAMLMLCALAAKLFWYSRLG
ncbi:MAG TPA: isoprenylcysteine carboxylmethyltransferase family protein [Clostridia bacterium]|nr:isoprenylcysteine carboxylmethyltransferase family protein [Clostridia bacterium]